MGISGFDGFNGSIRYHDMDLIAKHMRDTMRWYGVPVLIRRRYNIDDLEAGLTTRCECYNANYDQPASSACPICWGTGFTGGYFPAQFEYITMSGNLGHDEQYRDKQGYREEQDQPTISIFANELYRDGDVIARIGTFKEDRSGVETLDGFWEIDGKVNRQEEWGLHEPYNLDMGRHYVRGERLVSMTARIKLLLPTDRRTSDEFWGLS